MRRQPPSRRCRPRPPSPPSPRTTMTSTSTSTPSRCHVTSRHPRRVTSRYITSRAPCSSLVRDSKISFLTRYIYVFTVNSFYNSSASLKKCFSRSAPLRYDAGVCLLFYWLDEYKTRNFSSLDSYLFLLFGWLWIGTCSYQSYIAFIGDTAYLIILANNDLKIISNKSGFFP